MMSNFLLPVITIPTKINRGNNTLIDNIFTNHLNPDTKSGNLEIKHIDKGQSAHLYLETINRSVLHMV